MRESKNSFSVKDIHSLIHKAIDSRRKLSERHEAFGELVMSFQDMAFGCAYALLGDFYLAEDAAQEAFITAWQRLHQLRAPAAFPGWPQRMMLNQCNSLT